MQLPHGTTVAVADGAKLVLFRNTGNESHPKLTAMTTPDIDAHNKGSGGRHQDSDANPSGAQLDEDGFAAGTAAWLNSQALTNKIDHLVVIAAPRTLGELRKHFHKTLTARIVCEIAKDLTGHPAADVEKAIAAAQN